MSILLAILQSGTQPFGRAVAIFCSHGGGALSSRTSGGTWSGLPSRAPVVLGLPRCCSERELGSASAIFRGDRFVLTTTSRWPGSSGSALTRSREGAEL